MNLFNRLLISGLAVVVLLGSPLAFAQTVSSLQIQVNELVALVMKLQVQVAAILAATNSISVASTVGCSARIVPQVDLAFGSRGPDVVSLQCLLGLNPTGYFGLITQSALMDFQRQSNLSVTGFYGAQTRAAFNGGAGVISPAIVQTPATCAASFGQCTSNVCTSGTCNQTQYQGCQAAYNACLAPLPQACVKAYITCRALSTSFRETTPCEPGSNNCNQPKRDCLAEYKVCAGQ